MRKTRIFSSVSEGKTLAGAEFNLALVNAMFAAVLLIGAGMWEILILSGAVHVLLVWLHRYDPRLRQVYMRYMRQGDVYDPFPGLEQRYNPRPEGFARNYLC